MQYFKKGLLFSTPKLNHDIILMDACHNAEEALFLTRKQKIRIKIIKAKEPQNLMGQTPTFIQEFLIRRLQSKENKDSEKKQFFTC